MELSKNFLLSLQKNKRASYNDTKKSGSVCLSRDYAILGGNGNFKNRQIFAARDAGTEKGNQNFYAAFRLY